MHDIEFLGFLGLGCIGCKGNTTQSEIDVE